MRNRLYPVSLLTALVTLGVASSGLAQGTNYGTQVSQAGGAYYNQAVWKPIVAGVPTGTAVGITNGNIYTAVNNGTTIGNGLANTRIRSFVTTGTQVFPTNSVLVMNTNTELRIKGSGNNVYTINFPGSNGNPGLILNGGLIDDGDATTTYLVSGLINVAAQSYISHGNNGGGGGATTDRAVFLSGVLSGPGNMVILNASSTLPQLVSNVNNTAYTGTWIVQCGYLRGVVNNSLGTNSNVTVDPNYIGYTNDMPLATSPNGPAIFEVNYDFNCAGTLILTNGGQFKLHQNCAFSKAIIEGTPLTPGLHFYTELNTLNPNDFPAGGSGSITIQPYQQLIVGPQIVQQPYAEHVYLGGQARFNVSASGVPISTNWYLGASALADGGDIIGSTTTNLLITSVAATNVGNYSLKVADSHGNTAVTQSAPLVIQATNGETYEAAVIAAHPYAFYQFNEAADVSTNPPAFDNANGYNAIYGTGLQTLGIPGPQAPTWPGFLTTNGAVQTTTGTATAHLNLATPWAFNTNTVTITAWVNPSSAQNLSTGLAVCRGGDTVAGLNFCSVADINGVPTLGYIWANDSGTYNWNSGIEVPPGQWSFVSVAVSSSNAVVSLMNASGLVSSTHVYPHPVQSFNAPTLIGDDSAGTAGNRVFNGAIDDVAVFNRALSKSDLTTLFYTASGVSSYPAEIVTSPAAQSLYAGQTAVFTVAAGGSDPITYQWFSDNAGNNVFVPLNDGGRFSGTHTATLSIANIGNGDANNYEVIVTGGVGVPVTSQPAFLTVNATGPAQNYTLNFNNVPVVEAAGSDWNNASVWNPDGAAASVSAVSNPGSTYEVVVGSRLRNPAGSTSSTFPGVSLSIDGPSVLYDGNTSAGANTGEFRTKHNIDPSVVIFPKLILNGGQMDAGDNGTIIIQGEIDVATNSAFTVDSASTLTRNYQVDSVLKGSGGLRYNAIQGATPYSSSLDVTGNSNTFTGTWIVDNGTLVGGGTNSLGTNNITINAGGGLQSLYDMNSPNATLNLTGKMYLNQNDTFKTLFVNGIPLPVGTYTAAQLSTAYPTNFPANWAAQYGATNITNASGSITVLVLPAAQITQDPTPANFVGFPTQTAQFVAQVGGNTPLYMFWQYSSNNTAFTFLSDNAHISGSQTNTLTISNISVADVGYYRIIASNAVGSSTSHVAQLSLLPTGPAESLTLNFGGTPINEAAGSDWDTTNVWSDGQSADVSALSNPGSTYEVVVGSRLRNPANVASSSFPGHFIQVDGGGTLDVNIGTTGEIRFKHTPGGAAGNGTVFFPHLVLAGGQLDNGDNGQITIQGEVDVTTNSSIYVDTGGAAGRTYEIDAFITGSQSLTYQDFDSSFTGGLLITCSTNTFSGQWNVLRGCLIGGGVNSLGTNSITIASGAALETLYDIHSPSADLNISGQVFLHQNYNFATVEVGGVSLTPGTYSWSVLNSNYPTYFPANWTQQPGSPTTTATGSITVGPGGSSGPVTLGSTFSTTGGGQLQLSWPSGTLYEATNAQGPWTPVAGVTGNSYTAPITGSSHFFKVGP